MTQKNRKLESDVSHLQSKIDSMEDEAIIAKEFVSQKTTETFSRPTGRKF